MKKLSEARRMEGFGEDIGWLVNGGYGLELESVALKIMTNKVTIILNVLCSFMNDIIVGDLNGTAIITIKNSG